MTQARDLADGKFDTDTLVVDAANNRVGVGLASPSKTLHVESDSSSVAAQFKYDGSTSYIALENDTKSDGYIGYTNAGKMEFWANGSQRASLLSSGGLTFNGDTATANALDDYEEGTFTPVFISGASSWTYNFNNGRYVKVGKLCHIAIRIDAASVTTANSSGVNLGGLPFTAATSNPPGSFAIGYNNNFQNGGHTLTALGNANSTSINLYQDDGSSLTGTEANFTNDIYLSGTYETT